MFRGPCYYSSGPYSLTLAVCTGSALCYRLTIAANGQAQYRAWPFMLVGASESLTARALFTVHLFVNLSERALRVCAAGVVVYCTNSVIAVSWN